ncbi:MAG: ABC transporter substrate-binding protein [Muribaculaceae bacterium]|nr:ABC transporter substrate-binding protein [Muribaculaceae bacterium]
MLSGLFSCSTKSDGGSEDYSSNYADTLTHHARYLTISDCGNGTVLVDVANPWEPDSYLGRYALVHRDSVVPPALGDDVSVIRTPVEKAAVYSTVHTGGIKELGAMNGVCAVADAEYFPENDTIRSLIESGRIVSVGSSQNPSNEILASSMATVALRSPMQGIAAHGLPLGIAPIECADYMEASPIARAEWILLLGELFGRREEARNIFTKVIDDYSELVFKAGNSSLPKPKVLTETAQSGIWYVPAGESYMARMISDAGGAYPWIDTHGTGSLPLSLEKVAERALDADVWIVKGFGYTPTAETLVRENKRYSAFKAVREGNVYGSDTSRNTLYNDIAFHPEKLLADYVAIFHPDVMEGYSLRYFTTVH